MLGLGLGLGLGLENHGLWLNHGLWVNHGRWLGLGLGPMVNGQGSESRVRVKDM